MKLFRIALLAFVSVLCGAEDSPFLLAQHGNVTVDWKAELAKAKAGIEKNPKSAFWHNQGGVAYNSLGDFENAVRELKLAAKLDPSNPIDDPDNRAVDSAPHFELCRVGAQQCCAPTVLLR